MGCCWFSVVAVCVLGVARDRLVAEVPTTATSAQAAAPTRPPLRSRRRRSTAGGRVATPHDGRKIRNAALVTFFVLLALAAVVHHPAAVPHAAVRRHLTVPTSSARRSPTRRSH